MEGAVALGEHVWHVGVFPKAPVELELTVRGYAEWASGKPIKMGIALTGTVQHRRHFADQVIEIDVGARPAARRR